MSETMEHATLSLFEALGDYRIAWNNTDEDAAAFSAVGLILILFPGAKLLREIIETSFPRAARPAADDNAALSKMAELVANGQALKPASRQAALLAAPGASDDAIAQRLRRKFRSGGYRYLSSDSRAAIDEVQQLICDLFKRKAEHVDRPYARMMRDLDRVRRDLESRIADWEQRRDAKVSVVKNPDSRQKM